MFQNLVNNLVIFSKIEMKLFQKFLSRQLERKILLQCVYMSDLQAEYQDSFA